MMGRLWTITATVAVLASFFEAPYFHFHGDLASDHVRKDHLGQGQTVHTHLSIPYHPAGSFPLIQSSTDRADIDAIFLAQTSSLTQSFSLLAILPVEPSRPARLPSVPGFRLLASNHSHDPPLIFASSPRPPPA